MARSDDLLAVIADLQKRLGVLERRGAAIWDSPLLVASIVKTTSHTGISALTAITGGALTFTATGINTYLLKAHGAVGNPSVSGAELELDIYDNAVTTRLAYGGATLPGTGPSVIASVSPWCLVTPTAGSITYKMASLASGGTMDMIAQSNAPMTFAAFLVA